MSKTPGLFITGTDTEVGKTVVAAAIAMVLRDRGIRVGVMKPIATGCMGEGSRLLSHDAAFLFEAGENEMTGLTSPSRYSNPVAPNVAASIEKRPVNIDAIKESYEKLQAEYDFVIVEGIGGLMVPITNQYFVADMVRDFGLPLVVVARNVLGAINHTLLTIDAALVRGFDVRGLIFNRVATTNYSLAETTNPKVIYDLTHVPVLGSLPEMEDVSVERGRFGRLKEVFEQRVHVEKLMTDLPSHYKFANLS